jgi:hypothetical protein
MNIFDLIVKHFDKVAGIILTAVFGGYVAYRVNKKNRLADAGKRLLESFDITVHHINKYDGHFYLLENILRTEFESQKIAIREFRRHLNPITTVRFDSACRNYYGEYDDSPDFRQYVMSKDVQQTLLERINVITKFAIKS